jgi:hypothetical protein
MLDTGVLTILLPVGAMNVLGAYFRVANTKPLDVPHRDGFQLFP